MNETPNEEGIVRDGERAVATPLFHGQTVPSAVPVPRGFALLQGRHRSFLVRLSVIHLYYAR